MLLTKMRLVVAGAMTLAGVGGVGVYAASQASDPATVLGERDVAPIVEEFSTPEEEEDTPAEVATTLPAPPVEIPAWEPPAAELEEQPAPKVHVEEQVRVPAPAPVPTPPAPPAVPTAPPAPQKRITPPEPNPAPPVTVVPPAPAPAPVPPTRVELPDPTEPPSDLPPNWAQDPTNPYYNNGLDET